MTSFRQLRPGQITRVHIHDTATGEDVVVHEDHEVLLEAPNWSPDDMLLLNGEGVLWRLDPQPGAEPARISHEGLPEINNDHVLDVDGRHIFMSAADGHIYRAPVPGGAARRVTTEDGVQHFLHGVSPSGDQLAVVRMTSFEEPGHLALLDSAGEVGPRLLDTGPGHIDGPEWSPDGRWIFLNTEQWAERAGHAQIARVPQAGGSVERLIVSATVDWFPHPSPDGKLATYLQFPAGTLGHPADRAVAVIVIGVDDWGTPLERLPLPGGQGSMNVNSWAPDSRRFAYVSYPMNDIDDPATDGPGEQP